MVPRPVVVVVVLVLSVGVLIDLGSQYFIPGHTANPLIIGPLLALLGALLTGAKGPKPPPGPDPNPEPTGRHRGGDTT